MVDDINTQLPCAVFQRTLTSYQQCGEKYPVIATCKKRKSNEKITYLIDESQVTTTITGYASVGRVCK